MKIKYTISFPDVHAHYAMVQLSLSEVNIDQIYLKMAVWAPGSYLIREFAKNIDFVEYSTVDHPDYLRATKLDKNTWLIPSKSSEITIRYAIYCFEESVRTNIVNEQHALINGAATFLYLDGYENLPITIEVVPNKNWNQISTSLQPFAENKWIRMASNLDELIDSPIEIGNHQTYFFEASNVQHELAIYGKSNCNIEQLIQDLKAIVEAETAIFGSHPCKEYVFIIHHTENSFGGLEHLHSSVNHISRWSYNDNHYQRAISLLAHEYFHLWNVKRIRPAELSTFNYNVENYTKLLWFFEGITSYYDDLVCYRAGVTSKEMYLNIVLSNINTVLNTPGIAVQSLSESSFDTWIKYYRQNENSINSQINYYTKGAVIALMLDITIIESTNGTKCLDDVMYQLYQQYQSNPSLGISDKEIQHIIENVAGIPMDDFFHPYIDGVEHINIQAYFNKIGLNIIQKNNSDDIYLGMQTTFKDGMLMITKIEKGFGAFLAGLSVHDEIIAIDNFRVNKNYESIYQHKKINDTIDVLISRNGEIKVLKLSLTPDTRINYTIGNQENNNDQTNSLLKKWLKKVND